MSKPLVYELPNPDPIEVQIGADTFHIQPIGWTTWRDMIAAVIQPDPTNAQDRMRKEAEDSMRVAQLLKDHMDPDEYERFDELCRTAHLSIPFVMNLIEDVVGASSNENGNGTRPTKPPSPSQRGRSRTPRSSTGSRSSRASTSKPSPRTEE